MLQASTPTSITYFLNSSRFGLFIQQTFIKDLFCAQCYASHCGNTKLYRTQSCSRYYIYLVIHTPQQVHELEKSPETKDENWFIDQVHLTLGHFPLCPIISLSSSPHNSSIPDLILWNSDCLSSLLLKLWPIFVLQYLSAASWRLTPTPSETWYLHLFTSIKLNQS